MWPSHRWTANPTLVAYSTYHCITNRTKIGLQNVHKYWLLRHGVSVDLGCCMWAIIQSVTKKNLNICAYCGDDNTSMVRNSSSFNAGAGTAWGYRDSSQVALPQHGSNLLYVLWKHLACAEETPTSKISNSMIILQHLQNGSRAVRLSVRTRLYHPSIKQDQNHARVCKWFHVWHKQPRERVIRTH